MARVSEMFITFGEDSVPVAFPDDTTYETILATAEILAEDNPNVCVKRRVAGGPETTLVSLAGNAKQGEETR